jgi:hypothetical protein
MLLNNPKKAECLVSISKPSALSSGLSKALEAGSTTPDETRMEMPTNNSALELQAAQKLIARIAVRILMERKRKINEHQKCRIGLIQQSRLTISGGWRSFTYDKAHWSRFRTIPAALSSSEA